MRRTPIAAASLAAALVCAPPARPQQETQEPAPLRARAELVSVDVTVTDARGRFVRGLEPHRFRVLDEGAEQRITHFAPVEAPAVVLVLVETSPAVFLIHRQHLMAAHALLDGLAAGDQVALGVYDDTARLVLELTADKGRVRRAMNDLRYGMGATALNLCHSLETALDWLDTIPGKKSIVLLSTGLDPAPESRWEALAGRLAASDVAIFAVGLGGDLREFRAAGEEGAPLSFERASRALREMAGRSGGRAWFPRSAGEFPQIYRELALTLRHRYSLAFPPPERDGRRRTLVVEVLDERGSVMGTTAPGARGRAARYRVYARREYLAPQ